MSESLQVIRGQRIIQQLEKLDEATYAELERNTMQFVPHTNKRQYAVNAVQVQSLQLISYVPNRMLECRADIISSGNKYQSIIVFGDVVFQDEDTAENITFTGADNQEYHILPIQLQRATAKVRCTCLDFRWRFSIYNQEANALWGDGPGVYQKTTNREPNNPRKVPGVCKHLMKVAIELKNSRIVAV